MSHNIRNRTFINSNSNKTIDKIFAVETSLSQIKLCDRRIRKVFVELIYKRFWKEKKPPDVSYSSRGMPFDGDTSTFYLCSTAKQYVQVFGMSVEHKAAASK